MPAFVLAGEQDTVQLRHGVPPLSQEGGGGAVVAAAGSPDARQRPVHLHRQLGDQGGRRQGHLQVREPTKKKKKGRWMCLKNFGFLEKCEHGVCFQTLYGRFLPLAVFFSFLQNRTPLGLEPSATLPPRLWNSLPSDVRNIELLYSFVLLLECLERRLRNKWMNK